MDRLKKRFEDLRLKVRSFVQNNWHNDPARDVFRSLDILYILGAIRYKPTNRWQHICWNTYCAVSIFSFVIFVLNLADAITDKFDLTKIVWHIIIVSSAVLCFVKDLILNRHFESIQTVRNFINSKQLGFRDVREDEASHKKFFQRLQSVALVFFLVLLMDEIILNLPNSDIEDLFGTPRTLQRLGSLAVQIHILFLLTACPLWFNKYAAGTVTICSLLYGSDTEYDIFVRGFGNILRNVYSDVEEKLPRTLVAAPDWKRYQRDKLYWESLKQHVNAQVQQHVQLVENVKLLQPIVKYLFAIVYYNAMVLFSPMIYIVLFNGFGPTTLYMLSAIALNLLECYGWCRIIESYIETNKKLEIKIMNLLTAIPHSALHHQEYVDMRTTLCIMKIFVRNNKPFSCGGVFPITTEAFTNLLSIGYTVVTCLMNVGKKDLMESLTFNG